MIVDDNEKNITDNSLNDDFCFIIIRKGWVFFMIFYGRLEFIYGVVYDV